MNAPRHGRLRILVVDDHPVVREGLKTLIDGDSGMTVVGEAASAKEALRLYQQLRPDVVVLDLRLPDADGAELITRLRALDPSARIAVLSTYGDEADVRAALAAGALAYLRKSAAADELLSTLRRVERGEMAVAPELLGKAMRHTDPDPLTGREREVLRLLAGGLHNDQIAERLGVGLVTVKTHVGHIFTKLGARDRAEALVLALQKGLVHIP